MKKVFQRIITACAIALKNPKYLLAFLLLIPPIGYLLFLIPVQAIPGNDIALQLKLFSLKDYLLLLIVAALESLLIVLFVFGFRQPHAHANKLASFGHGNMGTLGGIASFLFGSKLCPMCIAALLGGLGPGAVAFTLEYRQWIFFVSIALLLFSIYCLSGKIVGNCELCRVNHLDNTEKNS